MKKKIFALFLLIAVLTLGVCACSSGSGMEMGTGDNGSNAPMSPGAGADSEFSEDAGTGTPPATAVNPRKLIRNAALTVESKSYDDFLALAKDKMTAFGGYVQSERGSGAAGDRVGTLTVRIPAEKLDDYLAAIAGAGNVTNRTVTTRDVTDDYLDITAHITALEAEYAELLNLYEKAGAAEVSQSSVSILLSIRNRMTEVLAELDSYRGQKNLYDSQVDYSTVTLSVYEVKTLTDVEEHGVFDQIGIDFMNNLAGVGGFFLGLFVWLIGSLPVLLVLAAVGFVIFLLVRRGIRRRKNRHTPPQP